MPTTTTLAPSVSCQTTAQQVTRKHGKKPAQANLLKLAKAADGFATKKEARESLQTAGFVATPAVVQELLNAANLICLAQKDRRHDSILKRLGHVPSFFQTSTRSVRLPIGTPTERLDALRRAAVTNAAKSMLRHGAAGGHTMKVSFAPDESKVTYVVTMNQNRDTYAGSFKGWAANEDHHRITVPKDWRLRVERKGLANLDGLLTLDAHPLMSDGDVQVYAATWARQGRGYNVHVDHGYIAVLGRKHFHADSLEAAIKGVVRKEKLAGAPERSVFSPYKSLVEAFVKRYASHNLTVSVSDATESGSCDFGIRSWCDFVGLDYDQGNATMAQVLEGFRMRPQEEVRRAVVHAVRRHRSESKALTQSVSNSGSLH